MNNKQYKDIDPFQFISLENLVSDGKVSTRIHTPLFAFCIKFCVLKLAKRVPDKKLTFVPTKKGIATCKVVRTIESKFHKNYFNMPHNQKIELIKEYMLNSSKGNNKNKHDTTNDYDTPFHIERIGEPNKLHINSRIKLHNILNKENKRTRTKRRQENQKWYLENLRELSQHPIDYIKKYIIPNLNMTHIIYGAIIAISLIAYITIAVLLMMVHPILSLIFIVAIPAIIWTTIHHKQVVNYFNKRH